VLDGFPAQAFDWDILRRIEVAKLGQDFAGNYPWHYPPPFLFVASVLALLPYSVAYLGWVLASIVPYLAVIARSSATTSAFCSRSPLHWFSSMRWSDRTASSPRR